MQLPLLICRLFALLVLAFGLLLAVPSPGVAQDDDDDREESEERGDGERGGRGEGRGGFGGFGEGRGRGFGRGGFGGRQFSPEDWQRFRERGGFGRRDSQEGENRSEAAGGESKASDSEKKGDDGNNTDQSKAESPETEVRTIKRDDVAAEVGELKVEPNAEGKIRFNFRGQPWPAVVSWLAGVSGMSLDWQELPADTLNLETQREYTLEEARDLINMHLLARGFTMLRRGEVLSVVKLDKLNPALIPHVEPSELSKRSPHEFARVTFPLDWLVAETAAQEMKPLLSPYGKLMPLNATNQLEAIDAVLNLQEIQKLLERQQSTTGEQSLVAVFKLRHARATEVIEKLRGLLGMEKPDLNSRRGMELAMQQTRMRTEMVKQLGKDADRYAPPEPAVHLVADEQENSILVNAGPDKVALVRQAIEALDVPSSRGDSPLLHATRTRIYRLPGLDPEAMADLLDQLRSMGSLDPSTRLQADEDNGVLIAYASAEDHLLISSVVKQLDTKDRRFEVIPLRGMDAAEVAGTIQYMFNTTQEEQDSGPWWRRGRRDDDEQQTDKFRVEADVARNRLLLWANEAELTEVEQLLVKLGATRGSDSDRGQVRVIDPGTTDTAELVEQLQRLWPSIGENPLEVVSPRRLEQTSTETSRPSEANETRPAAVEAGDAQEANTRQARREPATGESAGRDADLRQRSGEAAGPRIVLAATQTPAPPAPSELESDQATPEEADSTQATEPAVKEDRAPQSLPGEAEKGPAQRQQTQRLEPQEKSLPNQQDAQPGEEPPAGERPPVHITTGPDGRLIITSPDTEALDRLEKVLAGLSPAGRDFKVFQLTYAWAPSIQLNLEEIFATESASSGGDDWFSRRFSSQTETTARLSSQQPLKFVSDIDTNTLLVQNASPEQLRKIERLIEVWDRPEPVDSQTVRRTEFVQVQYARATTIAEIIKEVYRDLLSENDKALGQNGGERGERRSYVGTDTTNKKRPQFKGQLSIGVDSLSNQLVVSAPEFLIHDVIEMIRQIDTAAQNHKVSVVALDGRVNSALVQQMLVRALGPSATVTSSSTAGSGPVGTSGGGRSGGAPAFGGGNDAQRSGGFQRRGGGDWQGGGNRGGGRNRGR